MRKNPRPLACRSALLFCLSAALPLSAQVLFGFGGAGGQLTPPHSNVPPEQRCKVSGQVTNALTGEPVKRANLRLLAQHSGSGPAIPAPGQAMQGYSTVSEADGSYTFENVEPGTYTLTASRQGFLTVPSAPPPNAVVAPAPRSFLRLRNRARA